MKWYSLAHLAALGRICHIAVNFLVWLPMMSSKKPESLTRTTCDAEGAQCVGCACGCTIHILYSCTAFQLRRNRDRLRQIGGAMLGALCLVASLPEHAGPSTTAQSVALCDRERVRGREVLRGI
uniref:Uncharacterized protein n=1 Tax=Pfiesteria piscicida TaxID=71001 RepID=A3E3S8_PFIPI|nr:unknown [Pfiesteria piscicida]